MSKLIRDLVRKGVDTAGIDTEGSTVISTDLTTAGISVNSDLVTMGS
jgi:hypothetical protein